MAQRGQGSHRQEGIDAPGGLRALSQRLNPWNDRGHDQQHAEVPDPERRRKLNIQKLDNAKFQKLVTLVAASGFFIDGYLLFANNFALPILGYLYWPDDTSSTHEIGINCATLLGTITGQVSFGIYADRYGRKRAYGFDMLIVMLGSLTISMASSGFVEPGSLPENGSMNIVAWLVCLRFVIGFGVGAEYPISATIASEWAPVSHRGRMLAWVFSAQSFGQCSAAIVAYGSLAGGRMRLDAAWRLIYGLPAIFAFIVFLIRRTIPESPRYVYDVQGNAEQASKDIETMTEQDKGVSAANTEPDDVSDPDDPLNQLPPQPSYQDFIEYFVSPEGEWYNRDGDEIFSLSWTRFRFSGRWPRLLGTAGTWFLLDLSFFGLGLSSPQIVTGLWKGCRKDVSNALPTSTWNSEPGIANDMTPPFKDNEYAFWFLVSLGAITGSLVLIFVAKFVNRRKLLWMSFFALALFFFVIGGILWHKIMNQYSPSYFAVIVFYCFCQFAFNIGPNALTFMFPAEIFPTRYRCRCYGISAAWGKCGSIVAQLALLHSHLNPLKNCQHMADRELGKVLIGFGFVMLLGALVAWFLPNVQHGSSGESEKLEQLGRGPPRRTTRAADLNGGPMGNQQQQEGNTPKDILSGVRDGENDQEEQHPQGYEPDPSGGYEQPEPAGQGSSPPLQPLGNNRNSPVGTSQTRAWRKQGKKQVRHKPPAEFELDDRLQPGPSQP